VLPAGQYRILSNIWLLRVLLPANGLDTVQCPECTIVVMARVLSIRDELSTASSVCKFQTC
jgi:hypothetical protein